MKLVIDAVEKSRLKKLTIHEKKARDQGFKMIVGVDEAGRGPLAGPVVAAACFLPDKLLICGIDDSKKLTPKMRDELFEYLMSDTRIKYGIGTVCSLEIDRINILQATIMAMQLAIQALPLTPDLLLVDGMKLPHPSIPSEKIIGGDALSQSIAAASIIAKVTRDRMMLEFHEIWPEYGFDSHKGYGTARHVDAIHQFGPCSIHRQSFEPIKSILVK